MEQASLSLNRQDTVMLVYGCIYFLCENGRRLQHVDELGGNPNIIRPSRIAVPVMADLEKPSQAKPSQE